MQFCQEHWDDLHEKILEQGMEEYISPNGKEVARRMAAWAKGDQTIENWDPLAYAHNELIQQCLYVFGKEVLEKMQNNEEFCPLCLGAELHDAECDDPECDIPKDGSLGTAWAQVAANRQRATLDSFLGTKEAA